MQEDGGGRYYLSAEKLSVYSTAPADWAIFNMNLTHVQHVTPKVKLYS